jgi:hypothetical protein
VSDVSKRREMASRPSHETLMQRTSAPSKFNMEGIPSAFRAAIVVGAKASQAGARGAHDPSVAEMERKLGIDPGHDAQAMVRTDVAHLLEVGDQVRRRGTSAGGVATGPDAAQQQRMRSATAPLAPGRGGVRIAHPQARARYAEIAQKMESLMNTPVQPRPVYVYGTPPERRENPDAFRFALYVMPEGGRKGQDLDANCAALLRFTNRNCASIRDLLYVQDITSMPKVPSWLNQVPALLDRSTRNVYFGANAKSFVDEAIARENATTRAYVAQAMRERDQLVRTYQAEADQIVARYAESVPGGGSGVRAGVSAEQEAAGGGGEESGAEAYLMPPDEEELAHVFDEDAPNMLDPEQMAQIPEIRSKLSRGGPGQQYDASAHVAARGGSGGAGGGGAGRRGGGAPPPSAGAGGGQFISGLDVSGLNLSFRK